MTACYFLLSVHLRIGFKLQCDTQTLWNASISPSEAKRSNTLPTSASGQQLLAQLLGGLLCPAVQGRPQAQRSSSQAVAGPKLPDKLMKTLLSQTLFSGNIELIPPTQLWVKLNKLWHLKERSRRISQKYFISLSLLLLAPSHDWKMPYCCDLQEQRCSSHSFS